MNDNFELEFMELIQNVSKDNQEVIAKFMRLISAPFHAKFFPIIILILYYVKKVTLHQFIVISYAFLLLGSFKYLIKRPRPFEVDNRISMLETMTLDKFSFPSGHTFYACILLYVLKKSGDLTKENYHMLELIPVLVGLSRIYLGVHYPSDVIGAYLFFKLVVKTKLL
jgi:undecaprenyl-diphosphatase